MVTSPLTVVSGYWPVKNKHGAAYTSWFARTLNVAHPYAFFLDDTRDLIASARGPHPTCYQQLPLTEFTTAPAAEKICVHEQHCPSAELALIWNEKIFLLRRAAQENTYDSEWFCWLDAGLSCWRTRTQTTPLQLQTAYLAQLPQDKFAYSASVKFDANRVRTNVYYHHISGGVFVLHRSLIDTFCFLYWDCLQTLLGQACLQTEQVVLTHLYAQRPDLFLQLAHGYGALATRLFR